MKKWREEAYEDFRSSFGTDTREIIVYQAGDMEIMTYETFAEQAYHEITIENDCSVGKRQQYYVDRLDECVDFEEVAGVYIEYIDNKMNGDYIGICLKSNPNIDELLGTDEGLAYEDLKHLSDEEISKMEDEEEFIYMVREIKELLNEG